MTSRKVVPIFSVIIPTYNHAAYIGRCLDSLVKQTITDWEAIVVNNYSQDNTIEIVNSFKDSRITLVNFSNDGVIAASRNAGIRQAQGEWICFLDSDDWWYPNKLEVVSKYLGRADIIYHDLDRYSVRGKFIRKSKGRKLKSPVFCDLLMNGNSLANSSTIVSRQIIDAVGGLTEEKALVAVEDLDLWLRLAKITERFCYLPCSLGGYWVGTANMSEVSDRQLDRLNALYARHLTSVSGEDKIQALAFLNYLSARVKYLNGDAKTATSLFLLALRSKNPLIKLKSGYSLAILTVHKCAQYFRLIRPSAK